MTQHRESEAPNIRRDRVGPGLACGPIPMDSKRRRHVTIAEVQDLRVGPVR